MRGVNDRNFLNAWHILRRATCPDATAARWTVGDVEWQKERHSFSGPAYSVSFEVHLLRRAARGAAGWHLMVVTEYWWDGTQALIRNATWARVLGGNPKSVMAWLRERDPDVVRTRATAS
jgi:hypothetical protein